MYSHLVTQADTKMKKSFVAQSCWTLCDPKDGSPPGSSVLGIVQASILEWVTIPFSRGSSQLRIEPRPPALWEDSLSSEPLPKLIWTIYFQRRNTNTKFFLVEELWITLRLCLLTSSNFYSQLFIKIAVKSEFLLVLVLTTMTTS